MNALDNLTDVTDVVIYGYRWFHPTDGNTYHSVIVFVNGEELYRDTDMHYGYGEQYVETGFAKFCQHYGIERERFPRRWFEDHNIAFTHRAFDVKRKRDLFTYQPFAN